MYLHYGKKFGIIDKNQKNIYIRRLSMVKVFCVEDDTNIWELLEYTLSASGFEPYGFEDASHFYTALADNIPDIVLLDIMLPDTDGMTILSELKRKPATADVPVIMLTAKGGRLDKIKGLDGGADDYITKPFDVLELVSRINAVLRRVKPAQKQKNTTLSYSNIIINPDSRRVTVSGEEVVLTYKEFELLHMLIENNGIVLTRDRLMNEIWGTDFEGETRTVDVHIRTLRQKLGSAGDIIVTVRNVGYKVD